MIGVRLAIGDDEKKYLRRIYIRAMSGYQAHWQPTDACPASMSFILKASLSDYTTFTDVSAAFWKFILYINIDHIPLPQ